MNTSNLKNIVVLKDLPSNLVEEAIVVLKENKKIEKLELVDKKKKQLENQEKNDVNSKQSKEFKDSKDYIIKEAQMLIAEYISKIENKNKKENLSIQKLNKKCKRLKLISELLLGCLIVNIIIIFCII